MRISEFKPKSDVRNYRRSDYKKKRLQFTTTSNSVCMFSVAGSTCDPPDPLTLAFSQGSGGEPAKIAQENMTDSYPKSGLGSP